MGWIIGAVILYYLLANSGGAGGILLPSSRPVPATTLLTSIGNFSFGTPIPTGWQAWNLPDGSQVVVQPGAAVAPGGWVQATRAGVAVWFNPQTGQMQ